MFTIIVTQLPFVVTIWYSLHDWDFLKPHSFRLAGFKNYVEPLKDQFFRAAALHTVMITTGTVVLSVLLGTALALLLDRSFLGRG